MQLSVFLWHYMSLNFIALLPLIPPITVYTYSFVDVCICFIYLSAWSHYGVHITCGGETRESLSSSVTFHLSLPSQSVPLDLESMFFGSGEKRADPGNSPVSTPP